MFTTIGNRFSDCCQHEHETRDEAQRCLVLHQNEMRKALKISKRQIVEFESWDEIEEEYQNY